MEITVLCATSGQEKTTFLREQVERWQVAGRSVGGVLSPVVFADGRRNGYDVLDIRSGARQALARVADCLNDELPPAARWPDGPSTGVFRFDATAFRAGNDAIIAAMRDDVEIIVIDEIGPLELRGGGWAPALEGVLHSRTAPPHLVVTARPSVAEQLGAQFPSPFWADARLLRPPWPAQLEP